MIGNTIAAMLGVPSETNSYESIATTTLSSTATSVTFSSIPSTYTHLQLRISMLTSTAGQVISAQFNGDTAANYAWHALVGNGSAASAHAGSSSSNFVVFGRLVGTSTTNPTGVIMDILDYANTNKYKTSRILGGIDNNGTGEVNFDSALWQSTSAINSIYLSPFNGAIGFSANSSFALYGIKG
jgi:hypothetical protein